jgi:hypothetical protein
MDKEILKNKLKDNTCIKCRYFLHLYKTDTGICKLITLPTWNNNTCINWMQL